jgi:hypothetical protein
MKKDLTYQSEEMFMMHDEAVLCLNFSRDNELLVSGGWEGLNLTSSGIHLQMPPPAVVPRWRLTL